LSRNSPEGSRKTATIVPVSIQIPVQVGKVLFGEWVRPLGGIR